MSENVKKPYRCTFEGCKSSFSRPYRMAQHVLVHYNIRAFECEVCSKTYTSKSHLNRHINSTHKSLEPDVHYSCPTCLKTYANRQNLKRHIKIKHVLKLSFCCDICKKDFKKKNQIKAHMFIHTGVKSFSCEICQRQFVSLYEKNKHKRNHKTYYCDVCSMQFDRWSKCLKHRKSDHKRKEFVCNDCGRKFKQRIHIVRHLKMHLQVANKSNTKQFKCPYNHCQRVYTKNSNLKQHILIKHVKMTHECPICKAQLCTKAKLRHHLKLHDTLEPKVIQQKTKATGRKERKDIGIPKKSIALKLAGIEYTDKSFELNVTQTCVLPLY